MTEYRIFRPHDGKLPFSDEVPSDSLQSDPGIIDGAPGPSGEE